MQQEPKQPKKVVNLHRKKQQLFTLIFYFWRQQLKSAKWRKRKTPQYLFVSQFWYRSTMKRKTSMPSKTNCDN